MVTYVPFTCTQGNSLAKNQDIDRKLFEMNKYFICFNSIHWIAEVYYLVFGTGSCVMVYEVKTTLCSLGNALV